MWPVWHGFRGGKGAATLVGTILILQPILVLPLLAVWAWVLLLTGYVGLSTMFAAASAPVYLAFARLPQDQPLFVYCLMMALYLIYSHRSNIARMWAGTENRSGPALFFRRKRQTSDDGSD